MLRSRGAARENSRQFPPPLRGFHESLTPTTAGWRPRLNSERRSAAGSSHLDRWNKTGTNTNPLEGRLFIGPGTACGATTKPSSHESKPPDVSRQIYLAGPRPIEIVDAADG
jgi:hypothetical protein